MANKTINGGRPKLVALNDEVNLKVQDITEIVNAGKNIEAIIKQELFLVLGITSQHY